MELKFTWAWQPITSFKSTQWTASLYKLTKSYRSDEIQFHCPLLSGIDDEGNILVAGNDNRRIDILKADGSWGNLGIEGLEEFPACARVVGHKLFVKPTLGSMQLFKIN